MGIASNWERYFMGEAERASKTGKEPNTQVGVCIVDENNKIADTSYNWSFLKNNGYVAGCRAYATLFPSVEYVKDIKQSGIREIIYLAENNKAVSEAVKQRLADARIKFRKLDSKIA